MKSRISFSFIHNVCRRFLILTRERKYKNCSRKVSMEKDLLKQKTLYFLFGAVFRNDIIEQATAEMRVLHAELIILKDKWEAKDSEIVSALL